MNNLLDKPLGIDSLIQDIQIDLYSELASIWQGEIEGYGKIYRNPLNKGNDTPEAYATSKLIIPEWYNSDLDDYKDVYFDDTKASQFCFLQGENDRSEDEYMFSNDCKIVFMSNLDRLYPNVKQRQDSKQEVEAVQILRRISYNRYDVYGIERRIENIFREFSTKEIQFNNMNKRHLFAVNIKLYYSINDKCN